MFVKHAETENLKKYMLIFDLILATPFKNTGKGLAY